MHVCDYSHFAVIFSVTHFTLQQVVDSRGHLLTALGYGLWPSFVLISEIVQTFILADFCYYYVKRLPYLSLAFISLPLLTYFNGLSQTSHLDYWLGGERTHRGGRVYLGGWGNQVRRRMDIEHVTSELKMGKLTTELRLQ